MKGTGTMRDSDRKSAIILSLIGIVPVVWLALLIAPFVKGGLTEIVTGLMKSFEHPFQIQICEDSVKTVLFLFAAYAVEKNTAPQNGATQKPLIESTVNLRRLIIS